MKSLTVLFSSLLLASLALAGSEHAETIRETFTLPTLAPDQALLVFCGYGIRYDSMAIPDTNGQPSYTKPTGPSWTCGCNWTARILAGWGQRACCP